jgi:hypothetical protein
MQIKKLALALCLAGVMLALSSGPAFAGVVFYLPFTTLEDDDLDYVFDNGIGNPGTIGVGDRLVSVFEVYSSRGVFSGQGPTNIVPDELTGVADVTVTAVLGDGTLILGPTGAAGLLGGFPAGTAIGAWLDATPDLDVTNSNCGTRAACELLARDGALFFTAGFFGDPDESWTSLPAAGGGTIATVEGGLPDVPFGTLQFKLSIGIDNTGANLQELVPCAPYCGGPGGNGLVEVSGQGSILGGFGLDHAQWTARSDTDATVAPIPEPATLSLLGLGLLGLGMVRKFKKS